jgi:uncharacterized coiled-coil DUF342 family protein
MTKALYEQIEKYRLELDTKLTAAMEKRDVANREIKTIRAELDELPVRKTRRAKKPLEVAEQTMFVSEED